MNGPREINSIINYQEDSVVSREIVNKPTGTVTLFAFDKGQGLSEHTVPYDATVIITDGEAEITLDGVKYKVGTGEFFLMPAGKTHFLKANKPFKMILTMIKS